MVRVAQVMAGAVHGGAELFYERLCVALHGSGETVLAVIRRDPARAARLRAAGLEVAELEFGGVLDWRTTPRLRALLRAWGAEVAVSWMSRASAHLPRGPWVGVGRLGGYYDLRHYRRCDHLVGNTHGIVSWLRARGWPDARSHYLPNFAADLAGAPPMPELRAPPHCTLLGLGRLHADKGFDTLLAALARLPEARLLIGGAGPQHARLQALAGRLGVAERTHFLGWREDVASLLATCDVFVCSSRVEPLGNIVIEAWSARRPVVAASVAGPAELIVDGQDGLLVPKDDPAALAAAIRTVLADAGLRSRLAQAGRLRFETEFSREPVVAAWRTFLHRIAARPGSTPPDAAGRG